MQPSSYPNQVLCFQLTLGMHAEHGAGYHWLIFSNRQHWDMQIFHSKATEFLFSLIPLFSQDDLHFGIFMCF